MPAKLVSTNGKRVVRRLTDPAPVTEPARQQVAIAAAFAGQLAGPSPRAVLNVRLNPDLEQRLRLARAVTGQTSQQIMAEALDAYLGSRRALEALAKAVPADAPARRTRNGRFP